MRLSFLAPPFRAVFPAAAAALLTICACRKASPPRYLDVHLDDATRARELIERGAIRCEACTLRATDEHGGAIEVRSTSEFSDAFVHFGRLRGVDSVLDLTTPRYLLFDLLVPDSANLGAMKFNVRDARGNFGGVPEAANGFYGSERP